MMLQHCFDVMLLVRYLKMAEFIAGQGDGKSAGTGEPCCLHHSACLQTRGAGLAQCFRVPHLQIQFRGTPNYNLGNEKVKSYHQTAYLQRPCAVSVDDVSEALHVTVESSSVPPEDRPLGC